MKLSPSFGGGDAGCGVAGKFGAMGEEMGKEMGKALANRGPP